MFDGVKKENNKDTILLSNLENWDKKSEFEDDIIDISLSNINEINSENDDKKENIVDNNNYENKEVINDKEQLYDDPIVKVATQWLEPDITEQDLEKYKIVKSLEKKEQRKKYLKYAFLIFLLLFFFALTTYIFLNKEVLKNKIKLYMANVLNLDFTKNEEKKSSKEKELFNLIKEQEFKWNSKQFYTYYSSEFNFIMGLKDIPLEKKRNLLIRLNILTYRLIKNEIDFYQYKYWLFILEKKIFKK